MDSLVLIYLETEQKELTGVRSGIRVSEKMYQEHDQKH